MWKPITISETVHFNFPKFPYNHYQRRRQSQWYGFHRRLSVCLSVCFCFSHDISKTDAAKISKLDTEN